MALWSPWRGLNVLIFIKQENSQKVRFVCACRSFTFYFVRLMSRSWDTSATLNRFPINIAGVSRRLQRYCISAKIAELRNEHFTKGPQSRGRQNRKYDSIARKVGRVENELHAVSSFENKKEELRTPGNFLFYCFQPSVPINGSILAGVECVGVR